MPVKKIDARHLMFPLHEKTYAPKEGVWMEENIDSNCNGHIGRT